MSASARQIARPWQLSHWPRRYIVVGLFFLSTVLCYIDRVNISVAIIPMARDRGYDPAAQGVVLSAFFWGYLVSQLLGGWMADRFGGKPVLAFGVAIWSLATFLTPPASASFTTLLMVRVLLGIGEGVNFPAIHSLAARWTRVSERARTLALNLSGIHLGSVLALVATPPLILALGWPAVFYVFGALGAVWLIAWSVMAANSPEDSPAVTSHELAEINADRPQVERVGSVPWRRIFSEKAVWAIILAHVCNNWGLFILLLWMPTYLHRMLGVPMARVGNYALIPWLATFITSNLGGWACDGLLARGWSVTAVRKLMQTLAFSLGAMPLLILPAIHSPAAAVVLLTISAMSSALAFSGFGVNHLDVGPRYAGVLMGISNTAATVPGIVGVAITGVILQATGSFAMVFYLTAAIYFIGLGGYLLWGSGEQKI
ncbi:MAG TPA: ACS family MFS transporter [Candidatus Binataceae bacterium]|nr:ACS family MFS transporter [Candidatus Binataceae bacterium]